MDSQIYSNIPSYGSISDSATTPLISDNISSNSLSEEEKEILDIKKSKLNNFRSKYITGMIFAMLGKGTIFITQLVFLGVIMEKTPNFVFKESLSIAKAAAILVSTFIFQSILAIVTLSISLAFYKRKVRNMTREIKSIEDKKQNIIN